MGLRPDEREDFARQFNAAQEPSHREEILRRAAGFGDGEALAVMRMAQAQAQRPPVPSIIRKPAAFSAQAVPEIVADDGPDLKLPNQRIVMLDMKPENRAMAAAERAFAGDPFDDGPAPAAAEPPKPAVPEAPKPPVAAPIARQPDPAAVPQVAQPAQPAQAVAPLADRQMQRDAAMQRKFARDLEVKYAHLLPKPYAAAIRAAGEMPGGMEKLRGFAAALRAQDLAARRLTARQRANNYNVSRDVNNPNFAPGMRIRSLMQAVQNGDPVEIAQVHEIAGNPMGAARATNLAITDSAGDAQVRAEQAAAQANAQNAEPPKSVPEQLAAAMREAMAIPEPDLRYRAVRKLIEQLNPNAPPAQIEAETQSAIAAHLFRQNPADPAVQAHLEALRKDKDNYIKFAMQHLNMTREQAELMYNSVQPTPAQRGRDAVAGVGNWITGTADWLGGVASGIQDSFTPKPKG